MRGIFFRIIIFVLVNIVSTGCQENQAILAFQSNFTLTLAGACMVFISVILLVIMNNAKQSKS
ncbi:MAG TPA: hypothetical protein VIM65_19595 [Cyclobacteriaceae bacterium]